MSNYTKIPHITKSTHIKTHFKASILFLGFFKEVKTVLRSSQMQMWNSNEGMHCSPCCTELCIIPWKLILIWSLHANSRTDFVSEGCQKQFSKGLGCETFGLRLSKPLTQHHTTDKDKPLICCRKSYIHCAFTCTQEVIHWNGSF